MHLVIPVRRLAPTAPLLVTLLALGCGDAPDRGVPSESSPPLPRIAVVPPAPLATIPVGSGTARIWAYATNDLLTEQDPVNLVFTGAADPRAIRNALLALDGTRTPTFPAVFPFTCTWTDAIGGLMAAFGEDAGWSGSAVQLQCGAFGPIRFHLRLFKLGSFTVGNAHFEVLIPGTTDHQVLSWELAEQLVAYDVARTGLLGAAPASITGLNASPAWRTIPAVIYNGLPVDLRVLIGGPVGDVSTGVGIATDGNATALPLAGEAPEAAPTASQHFVIQFNQVIPRPFCSSGPTDFVLAVGPITLDQQVTTLPTGELRTVFRADGDLSVLPIDIFTGQPAGDALRARVSEDQNARAGEEGGRVEGLQQQQLLPASGIGAGQLSIRINVTPEKNPKYDRKVICH